MYDCFNKENFSDYNRKFLIQIIVLDNRTMDSPKVIDSIVWDDSEKKWKTEKITVEEYHGYTECRRCQKPLSHNVKTKGEFKVIYVKCGCG